MTDPIVDAIDNAIRDYETSPDAMRWTPNAPERPNAAPAPPPALWTFRHEPLCRVQRRWDCTVDELDAWYDAARRSAYEDLPLALVNPSHVAPPRVRPCLGCGAPVTDLAESAGAVTFGPCGCSLTVRRPPILGHVPDGTRLDRCVSMVVPAGELLQNPRALETVQDLLGQRLGQRPQVVLTRTRTEVSAQQIRVPTTIGSDDTVVIAATLQATLVGTPNIVYRAADDFPTFPGELLIPCDWEGRWEVRTGPADRIPVRGGTAHATGRIEINDDGAVAEVYEVRAERGMYGY